MLILVVDDSGFVRKSIKAGLRKAFPDAENLPAENGLEGYNKKVEHDKKGDRFDMVVMDHLVPELSGTGAMDKVLEFDQTAFMVFISATIQNQVQSRALESGGALFLSKPLKKSSLYELKGVWDGQTSV